MAGFAFYIELFRLHAFIFMPVVTGNAGHVAILKTFAGGKQAVLISVYVYSCGVICRIGPKEVEQPVTRLEAKGRFRARKCPAMAKPAKV